MAKRSGSLPRLDYRKDRLDKVAYFAAVFGGIGLIIFLRMTGVPIYYVVSVPIACIVVYALAALYARGIKLREDRVADNCYYLGFIYTLTSLAYALWSFHSGGQITEKLIQDFGVALVSTIVGVIARLLLNQLRIDPVEVEQDARMTLTEASQNLKIEMLLALRDFETFRVAMHQGFEESQQKITETIRETLEASAGNFSTVTKDLVDESAKIFKSHTASAKRIETSSERVVIALEDLVGRFEAVEVPSDILTSRLSPAITEIERAATVIRERAEAEAQRFSIVEKAIEKTVTAAGAVEAQVASQSQQAEALTTMYLRISASMEALSKDLESLSAFASGLEGAFGEIRKSGAMSKSVLDGVEHEARDALETLKRHNSEITHELEASRAMTTKLQDALILMADTMVSRLNEDLGAPAPKFDIPEPKIEAPSETEIGARSASSDTDRGTAAS